LPVIVYVVPFVVPQGARLLAVAGVGDGDGEGLGDGEGEPEEDPPEPPEPPGDGDELEGGDPDDEPTLAAGWAVEPPQPERVNKVKIMVGMSDRIRDLLRRARAEIFISASSVQIRGRAE
jgi:hypothetical protein